MFGRAEQDAVGGRDPLAKAPIFFGRVRIIVLAVKRQIADLDNAAVERFRCECANRARDLAVDAVPAKAADDDGGLVPGHGGCPFRSEEHTSELQLPMGISYAVLCLKKKIT